MSTEDGEPEMASEFIGIRKVAIVRSEMITTPVPNPNEIVAILSRVRGRIWLKIAVLDLLASTRNPTIMR